MSNSNPLTLMFKTLLLSCVLMVIVVGAVTAQDPQFSQFYAAPLYLNPALTGSTGQARVGMNYRNQWPAIDANFRSMSVYGDVFIEDKRSGVGMIITQDTEGLAGLRSLSLGLLYSYEMQITKNLGFRPGAQVAVFRRDVNFDKLTFGDQFDSNTGQFLNTATAEQLNTFSAKTFIDLSLGGVFFTKNAWLGISAWHLTQPNQSLIGESSPLPRKYSVHGGFKFLLKPGVVGSGVYSRKAERSISPAVQYRHQGKFDQMDVGMYFTFEPIVLGTWYRGIPFKNIDSYVNNESVVLMIGFVKLGAKDALNIGYSFDYTVSKLGIGSGGAHELSLTYTWPIRDPRKPARDKLIIPCPDF